ncbi:MAG TPA: hypothetical protein VF651_05940 [Gammaproteobacteria bacterium]
MWEYIGLAAGVLVVTLIAFMRLNSGKFLFAIDAVLMFLGMAVMVGITVEDFLGTVAGWSAAATYLAIVASVIFVSIRSKQEEDRKRAWKSWVKGGRYD